MSNKQLLAQKVTNKMKKDTVQSMQAGLPDGRSTMASMESWRKGTYEKLIQKGAAHFRVFRNITT